jgi:hypothetical protein
LRGLVSADTDTERRQSTREYWSIHLQSAAPVPSLFRQLQLGQVVAWTSGIAGALSVADKNGAHKSTLRGAE